VIAAIALLFVCLLVGEVIHRLTGVPLPGSIIGLGLLLGWLALVRKERPTLTVVSAWLTAHLSIMLLPSAVGVIDQGPMLARHGLGIVTAIAVSTVLTLGVTAWVFVKVAGPEGAEAEEPS